METTWLVAYDFSRLAHAALAMAADMLSKQGGGRLLVAHVHQLRTSADGNGVDLATLVAGDLERAYVDDAERLLREEMMAAEAPGVRLEGRVLSGRPAPALCRLASEEGARMIVVGSHGRRGVERLLVGSVAEAILRQAPCAVLVVKEPPPPPAATAS